MRNLLLLAVLFILMACQTTGGGEDSERYFGKSLELANSGATSFPNHHQIQGKLAQALMYQGEIYWLLTSERDGILLTDNAGKTLSQFPGNVESIDWRDEVRVGDKKLGLIAAIDKESSELLLVTLDWRSKKLALFSRIDYGRVAMEGLCWYRMPSGHASLFIIDSHGNIEQRIMVDANTGELVDKSVRQLTGAPDSESCAVDDGQGILYLAEPATGVWRYNAEPESDAERELILAAEPHGQVLGEVTFVDVTASGVVLTSAPEQQGIWLHDGTSGAVFVDVSPLEVETATALEYEGELLLGIYDDRHVAYHRATIAAWGTKLPSRIDPLGVLLPTTETSPVARFGDAADDPAIWVNHKNPSDSRVLGTDKKQGLMQYDLQGKLLQRLDVGRVNNVDLRYDFEFNGRRIDIAAASNRTTKSLSFFAIDPDSGRMEWLNDVATDLADIYGLCMYHDGQDYYAFANSTDGRFQQYLITNRQNKIDAELVREFAVASQPEGCVVDDQEHQLFFGEEARGIWQISAKPLEDLPNLIAEVNEYVVADVEGLAIYYGERERLLIASSQGNNSYAVYALDHNMGYLGSFRIGMDLETGIDGASETDGLDVVSLPLGDEYPSGLFVVQDGRNVLPQQPQNFKYVNAEHILEFISSKRR